MAGTPNVLLKLSNRAENVLLVRQALSGLAEAVELDPVELNDISTAVTEACNNVVLHAYDGDEGPLEVEFCVSESGLEVAVRDHGGGLRPGAKSEEEISGGIGLPVIQALADSVDFAEVAGGGTLVGMHFSTSRPNALEQPSQEDVAGHPVEEIGGSSDRTVMTVAPASLAGSVLPRVLATLAARAYFSTDRISDAQSLADRLIAHLDASASCDGLTFTIAVMGRTLELAFGPLRSGRADRLFTESAQDGLTPVLERLAVEHNVAPSGSAEMLALQIAQPG